MRSPQCSGCLILGEFASGRNRISGRRCGLRIERAGVRVALGQDQRIGGDAMAGERQVAIVTGAASGIGRAMSLGLLEGGIDVAAIDKEAAWLDELTTAASGRRLSGALQTIQADLTDSTSFDTIVSAVLGGSRGRER